MGNLTLKQVRISSTDFVAILNAFPAYVKTVSEEGFKNLYMGCRNKKLIYYDGNEYLICPESYIDFVAPFPASRTWAQVIVRRDESLNPGVVEQDITGTYAWNYMNKLLSQYYSERELEMIRKSYTNPYDYDLAQYHYTGFDVGYNVYENCVKYDINGAHNAALAEIFPRAADEIIGMYEKRKSHPNYKNFINYFVGMHKRKGYEGLYNYIVQRTTNLLFKKIERVGGYLLYANTDGFIVQNPNILDEGSKNLGEFKIEYAGTVYSYVDKNYTIFDCGGDLTGTALDSVRNLIDLPNRKVVHYNRVKNEYGIYMPTDITEEILNET